MHSDRESCSFKMPPASAARRISPWLSVAPGVNVRRESRRLAFSVLVPSLIQRLYRLPVRLRITCPAGDARSVTPAALVCREQFCRLKQLHVSAALQDEILREWAIVTAALQSHSAAKKIADGVRFFQRSCTAIPVKPSRGGVCVLSSERRVTIRTPRLLQQHFELPSDIYYPLRGRKSAAKANALEYRKTLESAASALMRGGHAEAVELTRLALMQIPIGSGNSALLTRERMMARLYLWRHGVRSSELRREDVALIVCLRHHDKPTTEAIAASMRPYLRKIVKKEADRALTALNVLLHTRAALARLEGDGLIGSLNSGQWRVLYDAPTRETEERQASSDSLLRQTPERLVGLRVSDGNGARAA